MPEIIWTQHALERQEAWEQTHGITQDEIEALLEDPDQVVEGHGDARVAQTRRGDGVLRAPFVDEQAGRKVLTVYWSSQVDRYWEIE